MKKLLAVAVLMISLSTNVQAHGYVPPVPPAPLPHEVIGGPAFVPFLLAVGGAAFVIYANATGLPFPLCGHAGLSCYGEYPHGKNGG